MDNIAERFKAYIDTHPFDPGDSDCESVLDQQYQAYAESHESDPPDISDGFKELEEFLCELPFYGLVCCCLCRCIGYLHRSCISLRMS